MIRAQAQAHDTACRGLAVCGVSAIIATKGAIEADDEDSSFSIAAILALGALALSPFR